MEDMDNLDAAMSILDYAVSTKRKKHIMGGILLSISVFFGGLAFTVMTIKSEEEYYERSNR